MKCPSCNCDLELHFKTNEKHKIFEGDCSLVEKQHAQIGKKIDEDYPSSKESAQDIDWEKYGNVKTQKNRDAKCQEREMDGGQ